MGARASTREYRKKVENNKNHSFGAPDVWAARSLLQVLVAEGESVLSAQQLDKLRVLGAEATPQKLAEWVFHAKVVSTYHKPGKDEMVRIELRSAFTLSTIGLAML